MPDLEWVAMTCVDCGESFEGEPIPGPYKRCPRCRFEFKKRWKALSTEERGRRIEQGVRLAAEHGELPVAKEPDDA